MGKNNKLIEQYKELHRQSQNITPKVYAGIALALHRKHGWGYKRINDLFSLSTDIWEECIQGDMNMIQLCEQETGIEVLRTVG